MKILLTGSSGQLGTSLRPGLETLGHLIAVDRRDLDLADSTGLRDMLNHTRPDLIVNAAAYTDVDGAESHRDEAFRINADVPALISEHAAEWGCSVLHFSTDYVFSGDNTQPWTEKDAAAPLNVYGKSKLAGDEAVIASGAPSLILRTSWVYAATGRNFLRTMLRLGNDRNELAVVADQTGAPTPAGVLAEVTLQILGQGRSSIADFFERNGGIVNAATTGSTSWYGFAEAIFDIARRSGLPLSVEKVRPISSKDYTTSAVRPLNSRLDLECLSLRFGIHPPHWREALERVMDQLSDSRQ